MNFLNRTSPLPSAPTAAGRRLRSERGAALVEFAVTLPLLALIVFGTVDLGRAYARANEVRNAAREGAFYAQTHPSRLAGTGCATPDSAQWFARSEAGATGAAFQVDVDTPAGSFSSADRGCAPFEAAAVSGQQITVTVSTPFHVLTPLVSAVTGPTTIRSSVTVTVQ